MGVINWFMRLIVSVFLGVCWLGIIVAIVFIVLLGWDHILNMVF